MYGILFTFWLIPMANDVGKYTIYIECLGMFHQLVLVPG